MTIFRFRLGTVLKVRESDREMRRMELAQALEAERRLQEQADALAGELATAKERYGESARPGAVDVDRLLELQRYVLHVTAQARLLAARQQTIRDEVEKRRNALTEADRQVRVLEKLRDKQHAAFEQEALKREQKELDEVGARVHRG